ncbi:C40 family peptidase [Pseudoclavibacter sp. 13-3]|uniref:C40 family peptidase n=1 Tax=Pseudoclavibacter sp. 13-3 TaxID=2901228 RepID=UPI001E2FBBBE|nr:C40 family peptidase [Pseudoclavibacter sp. 13-3]MCD7101785.1 C40 family peptidase [Pseudoclavibacter sp. 13-3]
MLIRITTSRLTATLTTLAAAGGLVFATAVPSQAAEVGLSQETGLNTYVRAELENQSLQTGAAALASAGLDSVSLSATTPAPVASPAAAVDQVVRTAGASSASADQTAAQVSKGTARAQVVVGSSIMATASQFIGYPYVSGGNRPETGFDCSGLVQYVYGLHGISLPRTDSAQKAAGTVITEAEAQPGDLVWWPGHIGFYAGNHQVLDAGNERVGVSQRAIWGSPTFVRI